MFPNMRRKGHVGGKILWISHMEKSSNAAIFPVKAIFVYSLITDPDPSFPVMRFFTDLGNTNVYIASIFLVGNLPMHSLTIHLRLMLQLTIQLRYGAKAVHLNCCKRQTSETNLSTTPFQNHQKFHTLPFPRFPELLATKTGGPK